MYTYDEVKKYIEVDSGSGCKLISKVYIQNHKKLELQCVCGNIFKVNFSDFKSYKKYKCNECSNRKRWTYDEIKQYIEIDSNSGCKLISTSYKNTNIPIEIQCKCGNIFKRRFHKFYSNNQRKCRKCTNNQNFGADWPSQNYDINIKRANTRYKNGTTRYSQQQKYVCDLFGGKLNYPIGVYSVDILLDNNIVIEWDGSGHELLVTQGAMTQDKFNNRESYRNDYIIQNNYKIIRIISVKDKLPSDDIFKSVIQLVIEHFNDTSESYCEINLDIGLIKFKDKELTYNFGELRKISTKKSKETTKLTKEIVLEIVNMVNSGKKQVEAAEYFGVYESLISKIMTGQSWSSVTGILNKKIG